MAAKRGKGANPDGGDVPQVVEMSLDQLLLDHENPRFGNQNKSQSQSVVLDRIIETVGLDDVLSSLAVNGYFTAEPMVCRRIPNSDKAVVLEGNRRLAACLIIANDERAKMQSKRANDFRALWKEHGSRRIDPIPAIVFREGEDTNTILSYLGVRHIAGSQPWDSYAKAAWIAHEVEKSDLSVEDISKMIGDQHRTVQRMLEGYYVVKQLAQGGYFTPENSIRKGRGSVTDYPFSWVYTILGYSGVREYLGVEEMKLSQQPIPEQKLQRGKLVMDTMLGNSADGRNSAVRDSRQLGQLANAISNPEKRRLLEQGKSVDEIGVLTLPLVERLNSGLGSARDDLRDMRARLIEENLEAKEAEELLPTSTVVRKLAAELERKIKQIAEGDDGDD